jgi:proline iminopeptidase
VREGYFASHDGLKIFYRKLGAGPEALVYLHGGPQTLDDGGYDMDPLARGRTLLMFEQRTGVQTEQTDDPKRLTVDAFVRDLEAFRAHFGLEKMSLMGLSWGSMLAVLYTEAHPDRVSRLVLVSPGPVATSFWPERSASTNAVIPAAGLARLKEIHAKLKAAPDSEIVALCREEAQLGLRPYVVDPASLGRSKGDDCRGTPAAIRHSWSSLEVVMSSLGIWDFRPKLSRLNIPVLVVEGASTTVPLDSTRDYASYAPDGRLLLIPHAGHLVYLEGAAPFFEGVDAFLKGQWPAGAVRPGPDGFPVEGHRLFFARYRHEAGGAFAGEERLAIDRRDDGSLVATGEGTASVTHVRVEYGTGNGTRLVVDGASHVEAVRTQEKLLIDSQAATGPSHREVPIAQEALLSAEGLATDTLFWQRLMKLAPGTSDEWPLLAPTPGKQVNVDEMKLHVKRLADESATWAGHSVPVRSFALEFAGAYPAKGTLSLDAEGHAVEMIINGEAVRRIE